MNKKVVLGILFVVVVSFPVFSQKTDSIHPYNSSDEDTAQLDDGLIKKINRNAFFIEVGGVANVMKISYSKNFNITKKIGIAPRVGLTTLGVDLTWDFNNKVEFYGGSRGLLLLWIPLGAPFPFGSEYYPQYEDVEFLSIINSVA